MSILGALSSTAYIPGCYVIDRGFSYFLCWLPAFGFETTLVVLMLYRGLNTRERGRNTPLLNVIIRDRFVVYRRCFLGRDNSDENKTVSSTSWCKFDDYSD